MSIRLNKNPGFIDVTLDWEKKPTSAVGCRLTPLGIVRRPTLSPSVSEYCDVLRSSISKRDPWCRATCQYYGTAWCSFSWFLLCHNLVSRRLYHWETFTNINDNFKRVIGILVNWHIVTGNLTRIARAILVKIPVWMCQFTKILITRLKESFKLVNFCQRLLCENVDIFVRKVVTAVVSQAEQCFI